ncbi:MAG: NAD-dependent epimerase/dehydratase family protein [Candidatus Rokuibacteriota bacterium]
MRLLVTGGAGFIGSHLTERLLDLGHEVRVLDNFSTGRRENLAFGRGRAALDVREGDLRDAAEVCRAVAGVDGIFHQAALVSVPRSIAEPALSFEINAAGTLRLFEAARRAGVRRIVYASSAAVYGDGLAPPLRETMALRPLSPYGLDKLYTEQLGALYASLYGLAPVALRYFNVFGPRQDPGSPYSGVISILVDRLRGGEAPTIYGDGEQTRDFVYVLDVVEANLASMWGRHHGFRAFNVGRGERLSLNGLVALLQDLMDVRLPVRYAPARAGDIRHSQADISAIAAELGFTPQWDVKRGLAALVRSLTEGDAA